VRRRPGLRRGAGRAGGGAAPGAGAWSAGRPRRRRLGVRRGNGDRLPRKRAGLRVGAARDAGATRIVVGLGGSASTDGGRGLVEELGGLAEGRRLLADVELIAATD